MANRFVSYLGAKPKSALAIIICLVVALVLVSVGSALELTHFGRAPYPSEIPGFSLVNGNVMYTNDRTEEFQNATGGFQPIDLYKGAKMAIGFENSIWSGFAFGNASQLSAGKTATVTQPITEGGSFNISIDITDSTGDGAFDIGDTILFEIAPFHDDRVGLIALAFYPLGTYPSALLEWSFVVHDGKVYSWFSHNLSTQQPWFSYG